jgi:hypothetical protein
MSLTDEIDYPTRGDDALTAMLIGGGLLLAAAVINLVGSLLTIILIGFLILPFAFVPQILTQGYLVRVLDDTLDGGREPPTWGEWGELFVDGLKLLAVAIVYSIPLVLLAVGWVFVAVLGSSVGASAGGDAAGAAAGLSVVLTAVFSLVLFVLSLAVFYVLPIGLCGMVQDDSLGGAFDLGRLRTVATDRSYAVAWLFALATLLVGGFVAQLLFVILVGFPLAFAVQVLGFRLVARGYADALGVEVAPAGATAAGAGAASVPDPDPLGGSSSGGNGGPTDGFGASTDDSTDETDGFGASTDDAGGDPDPLASEYDESTDDDGDGTDPDDRS